MVLYGTGRYGMEVVNSRAGRRESGAEQGGAGGGGDSDASTFDKNKRKRWCGQPTG